MSSEAKAGLLAEVPAAQKGRIVSGMRWTFWLSALGVPFSYGTSVLLARTGPEVIGTYGLLILYVGVVSSLFYVGGDAVVIKFVPELRPQVRLPFLGSYFLVIAAFLAAWMVLATFWPHGLHYLFGDEGGTRFQLLVVYLAPLYVLFSMTVAAHKAALDMRTAHLLNRTLTVASFLLYAVLFFAFRGLLGAHPAGLIWGIYLGLTALLTVAGVHRLVARADWKCQWRALRFFLPAGFWRYALTTEQVSIMSFLIARIDLILVMNVGGLALLGKYVAILSLADVVRAANRFFIDTLLPSLTNLLSEGKVTAASQVFSMNLRLLFAVDLAGAFALVMLVDPVLRLLGPQYAGLRMLFVLMLLFHGVAAPGQCGGILLSSVGRQHRAFWVYLGQIGLYAGLFWWWWPRFQLLGAVLAAGVSLLIGSAVLLVVAARSTHVRFTATTEYAASLAMGAAMAFVTLHLPATAIVSRLLLFAAAASGFLLLARYSPSECRELLMYFVPARATRLIAKIPRRSET
jgi:O-antigen/teichoic acid export membrane protein